MNMLFKKAIALLLCIIVLGAVPVIVSANESEPETVRHLQLITSHGSAAVGTIQAKDASKATVTTGEDIAGKKAVKTIVKAEQAGALHLNITSNRPKAPKSGDYLEFDFYAPDAKVLPSKIEVHTNTSSAWTRHDYYFPELKMDADGTVPDGWHHIKIDMDDFYTNNAPALKDTVSLAQVLIYIPKSATEDTTFYVTDMYISRTLVRATAECTSAKMDEDGRAVINLIFRKPIEPDTVSKEAFSISGFTCTDAVYSADDNSVTLTFAEMLEFPKEYALSIADTVTDSDGYAVVTTPVVFITGNFQSDLFVKSLVADKSTAAQDGVVKISAEATTIYRRSDETLKFKAIAAVVRGGSILSIAESAEVTAADRGQNVSVPQLTIADESLKTFDGTEEIQMFIVSAVDGLMPLAEVKSIEL